jgi:hypothetical protein
MILSHVSKQAYIAAIDDDFLMAAILTFMGLIPFIIMRTKNKKTIVIA